MTLTEDVLDDATCTIPRTHFTPLVHGCFVEKDTHSTKSCFGEVESLLYGVDKGGGVVIFVSIFQQENVVIPIWNIGWKILLSP